MGASEKVVLDDIGAMSVREIHRAKYSSFDVSRLDSGDIGIQLQHPNAKNNLQKVWIDIRSVDNIIDELNHILSSDFSIQPNDSISLADLVYINDSNSALLREYTQCCSCGEDIQKEKHTQILYFIDPQTAERAVIHYKYNCLTEFRESLLQISDERKQITTIFL